MNNPKLIQLIRESINEYIREIDHAGEEAAVSAKIAKIGEAIKSREQKMNMEGIDEAYHDMIDKGKMKELSGEVKALKKSLAKYEKQLEKLKNKGEKKEKVEDTEEKEIVDEMSLDENNSDYPKKGDKNRFILGMDWEEEDFEEEERFDKDGNPDPNGEYDAGANYLGPKMEESMDIYEVLYMQKIAGILSETEYKTKVEEAKKMTAAQKEKKEDIVKGMKKSKNFGKSKDEKAKMYATATKLATKKTKSLKEEVMALFEDDLNELSPELLQRAGEKAQQQGRTLQANKFNSAASAIKYKAAQIAKDAKLEPVKPFVGKEFNLYFDVKTDKGIIQALEIPFKIDRIQEDTSGALIVALYGENKYGVYKYPHFYFLPDKDHFTLSSDISADTYLVRGMDQVGANMMWKLAKAFKPDTQITPNTLIQGAPTPIAGKAFKPTQLK